MRNIRLAVSYEGTRYYGFQIQPDRPTIQGKLQEAIFAVTAEKPQINGSGRTDAGVHARAQIVNFFTRSRIPNDKWCQALNAHLPDDIVVWAADEVPESFHARKSAVRKTYVYQINASRFADPLLRRLEFHHPGPLQIERMEEAIRYLEGEHDFTSFASVHSSSQSKVRTIYEAKLERMPLEGMEQAAGAGRIRLKFTGNGFLYNMVRIMAGTLLSVGEGKLDPADIPQILAAKDRSAAGPTAKPHGLTLWNVEYEL